MNRGWNHIPGRCCILAFSVLHTLATQIRKAGCHPAALTGCGGRIKCRCGAAAVQVQEVLSVDG